MGRRHSFTAPGLQLRPLVYLVAYARACVFRWKSCRVVGFRVLIIPRAPVNYHCLSHGARRPAAQRRQTVADSLQLGKKKARSTNAESGMHVRGSADDSGPAVPVNCFVHCGIIRIRSKPPCSHRESLSSNPVPSLRPPSSTRSGPVLHRRPCPPRPGWTPPPFSPRTASPPRAIR